MCVLLADPTHVPTNAGGTVPSLQPLMNAQTVKHTKVVEKIDFFMFFLPNSIYQPDFRIYEVWPRFNSTVRLRMVVVNQEKG
jgi:hypothetical protein